MRQDDRPYLEIRITLIHIVIMIVAVVLLGFLLTYLGYKAGKASIRDTQSAADVTEFAPQSQALNLPADAQPQQEVSEPSAASDTPMEPPAQEGKPVTSAIEEELRLHKKLNSTPRSETSPPPSPQPLTAKPVNDKVYYAIQVGAFGNFQNAKTYAGRFSGMGYKTEIVSSESGSTTLYRVWVGQYTDRSQALQEKGKLEKTEKKRFSLVSNR